MTHAKRHVMVTCALTLCDCCWLLLQYPPLLPPGAAPGSVGFSKSSIVAGDTPASNSGLEASSSVQLGETIKLHHVICNSELVLKEIIGSGAEGRVFRGTWTNIDIAAKEYLDVDEREAAAGKRPSEQAMQSARNALCKEVGLLTSFNHPNLVRFCGVCLDPPLVVMEYYRHGNVYSMLEKARRQWSNLSAKAQPSRQATKVSPMRPASSGKQRKFYSYFWICKGRLG
eukprot:GHRQ01038546.1.p1 GENE.GHRQ01038546.1~~GHRQ01038546.1.p1  ORF type:complete len:228 (+),score=79.53 GHRQ01038546.1:820-1503(+)